MTGNAVAFSLWENPFFILNAKYSSSTAEIADLLEDAEFDGHYEVDVLQKCQQTLVTPRLRVEAEQAWLPELSDSQVKKVLDTLRDGSADDVLSQFDHYPELARANLAAHFLDKASDPGPTIECLAELWDDIDPVPIANFLNAERSKAGLPELALSQFKDVNDALRSKHAKAAAIAIWNCSSPGEEMNEIVEQELRRNPDGQFLGSFVREYDFLSEGVLSSINSSIDEKIEEASRADETLGDKVKDLVQLLSDWDAINQPVQIYEQHRGHEEGRSKQVYEKVRALCLKLANEEGRFIEAKRLSEALLETFPELESVAASLEKDLSALTDLVEQEELNRNIAPLVDACERAKRDPLALRRALKRGQFNSNSDPVLAEIYRGFQTAKSASSSKAVPYVIVRDLALELNNEKNDSETSFRLIDAFLKAEGAGGPQDIIAKLEDERAIVHKNWKMKELDARSGDLAAMSQIIEEMLVYAKGKDRAELSHLKSSIDKKRNARRVKWAVYAAIAGVVGFFFVSEEFSTGTTSFTGTSGGTRAAPPNSYQESRPASGSGRLLTTNEVRYCVFQGRRLDYMRPLANTNYEIDRFNALIGDYNSRCSNFQYRPGVLSRVEAEASARASQLQSDARRIASGW